MEEKCPKCHIVVRPTDYFCYNCGNNLRPAPPSTSFSDQMALYIKSVLLPPFGLLWAIKYLKYKKSRVVGIVAVVLTLTSLVIYSMLFINFVNKLNDQVSEQLNSLVF